MQYYLSSIQGTHVPLCSEGSARGSSGLPCPAELTAVELYCFRTVVRRTTTSGCAAAMSVVSDGSLIRSKSMMEEILKCGAALAFWELLWDAGQGGPVQNHASRIPAKMREERASGRRG